MGAKSPTDENGDELYQWTDGKWYTIRVIRRLSHKQTNDMLSVRTLSTRGTEQAGRTSRDPNMLGGSDDFRVVDDE